MNWLFMAGVLIIGDSISANPLGWANLMRNDDPSIQVMAIAGRTIRDFSLPQDLVANGQIATVVYWLGINDAFNKHPIQYVERSMVTQLHFLMSRGFRTIVLIPPFSPVLEPYSSQVRDMFHKYCDARLNFPKLECYEVEPWVEESTLDSIHPTEDLHRDIARWMVEEIL